MMSDDAKSVAHVLFDKCLERAHNIIEFQSVVSPDSAVDLEMFTETHWELLRLGMTAGIVSTFEELYEQQLMRGQGQE